MSPTDSFIDTERQFAAHLRDPDNSPAPAGIEDRRLEIYRGLVYRNVEGFIASGFPVLRSILDEGQWGALVRGFLREHRCHSPYFLDIGREFITYLMENKDLASTEPPYLVQLCHYEWVELALDVADEEIPDNICDVSEPLDTVFGVSPLVWRLHYDFPVHRISADNSAPEREPAGVHLLVYRNREDRVRFMEVNSIVSRLVQRMEEGERPGGEVLESLAHEIGYPDRGAFADYGREVLRELFDLGVLYSRFRVPPA